MSESLYEEYMRSVLGYQPMNSNTYDSNWENLGMFNNVSSSNAVQKQELENCYPDIYRIIYPMVQKACNQNTKPITRELIDTMTDEIYSAIEDNETIESRNKKEEDGRDNKAENRQNMSRNSGLNDLVKILILRELLGRPGLPGNRPPHPGPPRPPMRPPMGPPRPGMFNRDSNYLPFYNNDLYEI